QRALIEANAFVDHWAQGQPNVVQFTPRPAGSNTGTVVWDITVRYNRWQRVDNATGVSGTRIDAFNMPVGSDPTGAGNRILYFGNLLIDLGYYLTIGADSGDIFNNLSNHANNVTWDHNTSIITTLNPPSDMQTKLFSFGGLNYGTFPNLRMSNSIAG